MGQQSPVPFMISMTDEQAMWRVQTQDDHQAFARLVDRWEKPIFRLCARLTVSGKQGAFYSSRQNAISCRDE